MSARASRQPLHDQRGSVAVELALVLPLLLVVLLAIVDFGKAFNYWNDANQIAGNGARLAAVNHFPEDVEGWLEGQALTPELLAAAEVCVEFPDGSSEIGDPVKVNFSADYDWLPYLVNKVGLDSVTLTGSATMRLEAQPDFVEGCS